MPAVSKRDGRWPEKVFERRFWMTEMLAGKTVPLDIFLVAMAMSLLIKVIIFTTYSANLGEERIKSVALRKEITRLKDRVKEAEARPPVVVMESGSLPKNWQGLSKIFGSRKNFSRGAMKMSKSNKEKGVLREVGFFRLATMFGLFAMLVSMAMTAWEKVKHRFDENDDEPGPD